MARPRRTTEEEWFDVFATWDADDQAVALRVLEQIHRIAKRSKPAKVAQPEQPSLSGLPDKDQR